MTPARLAACLGVLHWSHAALASELSVSPNSVLRWANGREPIPPRIAAWLEWMVAVHERNPAPGAPPPAADVAAKET